MPTSNHNVNSATTMQNTGELAPPLVVPVRIQCVLLYPFCLNIVEIFYRICKLKVTGSLFFGFQEANYRVDSVENTPSDWIEHTSRNGKKYVIPLFNLSESNMLMLMGVC